MKIHPVGEQVFYTDGRTDGRGDARPDMTKLKSHFSQFLERD
jgi:hypothetical protein